MALTTLLPFLLRTTEEESLKGVALVFTCCMFAVKSWREGRERMMIDLLRWFPAGKRSYSATIYRRLILLLLLHNKNVFRHRAVTFSPLHRNAVYDAQSSCIGLK